MPTGTFYQLGDEIRGELRTLTTSASVASVPVYTSKGGVAPSDVVVASGMEVGVAWPAVPAVWDRAQSPHRQFNVPVAAGRHTN